MLDHLDPVFTCLSFWVQFSQSPVILGSAHDKIGEFLGCKQYIQTNVVDSMLASNVYIYSIYYILYT